MAITGEFKITQGANTDAVGNAVFGTLTDGVVVCQSLEPGITAHLWELIYVPTGSAIAEGSLGTASSASFAQPDVRGGYCIKHTATFSGGAEVSYNVLQVKEVSGRYIPPFKATDRALRFSGQADGWAPAMEAWLKYVDSIPVPSIVIASFAANTSLVECSQVVASPAFTASYTGGTVSTAVLTNNSGNGEAKNVAGTPTAFTSSQSYQRTTPNQSYTFTLNATGTTGGAATPRTATITWGQKNFWGVSSAPANTEAFIEALASNALATTRNASFTVNASGANKIYYACPTRYGTPTFTVGGFAGGFIQRATGISVTNAQGFTETYDLYESVTAGLGSISVVVS